MFTNGKRPSLKKLYAVVSLLLIFVAVLVGIYLLRTNKPSAPEASSYQYFRQAVITSDNKAYSRECLITSTNEPDSRNCTPWSTQADATKTRGVGNESYGAYSAFVYTKNNTQWLRQALVDKSGTQSWLRDCPIDPNQGILLLSCTAWPTTPSSLTNLRGVGGEAYSGFSTFLYVKSGVQIVRQALISLDGTTSWYRECDSDSVNGPNFNSCRGWSAAIDLRNLRGTGGNEKYGSQSSNVFVINGQQYIRQVLVSLDGTISYSRTCQINDPIGIDPNTCSSWLTIPMSQFLNGILNASNISIAAYEEFTYTYNYNLVPSTNTPQKYVSGTRYLGAAVDAQMLMHPGFLDVLLKNGFRSVSPNLEMKMETTEPQQGQFNFTAADTIVNIATAHNLRVQGTPLVWSIALPPWVTNGTFTKAQMTQIMKTYIQTMVGRYKGKVQEWVVVNEAILEDGSLRKDSVWYKFIGPEYIDLAFQFAHEADPSAILLYNDFYSEGINTKSNAIYNLISSMKSRGIPINGVGFQSHISKTNSTVDGAAVSSNISRYASIGLDVYLTELDVAISENPGSQAKLDEQAVKYKTIVQACVQAPNCKGVTTWGLSDALNGYGNFSVPESPLLLNREYQPKPAYWAVAPLLGISLNPTSTNHLPVGTFDEIDPNGVAYGWAVDPDTVNDSLTIHFYADAAVGQGGVFIGSVVANEPRADVNQSGYPGNHGFHFSIPLAYRSGTHSLYAYGLDSSGGQNALLTGSPRQILKITPTPTYTNTPTPTFTPTVTATLTKTPTPTFTKTPTPTFSPTLTPTFTVTGTRVPTPSFTVTATKTPTLSLTATNTSTQPIPGDANGDRKVDGVDYSIWLFNYGTNRSGASNGDFNSDGKVDGIDFVVWLNHYGTGI